MQNGARFGGNKGSFSGYAKQSPPIFEFFEPIGGFSPSIHAFFSS